MRNKRPLELSLFERLHHLRIIYKKGVMKMASIIQGKIISDFTQAERAQMTSAERKELRDATRKMYREQGLYDHAREMNKENPLDKKDKADYTLGKSLGIF